jgi:hypothetical protein
MGLDIESAAASQAGASPQGPEPSPGPSPKNNSALDSLAECTVWAVGR